MITLFLGIDPGMSGAMVFIDAHANVLHIIRGDETYADQWESLKPRASAVCFALIERVSAMPKQGVSSTFKFGVSYGFLQGMLVAAAIRHEFITPLKWQGAMGCRTHGDKNISKARAQQLFPKVKVIHQTADALLIAECARRLALEMCLYDDRAKEGGIEKV